jgi:hypothetical protein
MSEEYPTSLTEILDFVDRLLGESGMPPSERPFHAALTVAQDFVTEVTTDGGKTTVVPGDTMSIMVSDWLSCGLGRHSRKPATSSRSMKTARRRGN